MVVFQLTTTDTNATLEDLFPGAVYEIQVAAISHGLRSERHTVLKPVREFCTLSILLTAASHSPPI